MKLKYKGLEFEVDQITEDNSYNLNYSWAWQQYYTTSLNGELYITPIRNNKIICRCKERLSIIEDALKNHEVEQKAIFSNIDGDWEIIDLQLLNISTSIDLDNEFISTLTFMYSKSEYIPGSKLGFFR